MTDKSTFHQNLFPPPSTFALTSGDMHDKYASELILNVNQIIWFP